MDSLDDPRRLSDLVGRIHQCVLDPTGWEGLLREIGGLIGARRGMLAVSTGGGRLVEAAATFGLPSVERMLTFSPINPMIPMGLIWEPDRAFVASQVFGEEAIRASRFHREYLAPLGDRDAIAFILTREGDAFGHWALVTQEDRPPITDAEAAGLERLAPHLRRAVEMSRLLGHRRLDIARQEAALAALDAAVLILDPARRLAFATPRGERELSSGRVLRLRQGRVVGATDAAEAALRRFSQGGPMGGEALIHAAEEEKLLFALPLPAGGGRLLLILRDPRQDTLNPITIAARTFGLTPAQVQVLAFLAQGHAPDDIADILGVSIATVRSHLAELFARTGTARQAELVARTLALASPLGPG